MKVGQETRRYFKGTPMGEQSACAKANGVGLDAELSLDEERALTHGDAARNLSLAYVDDAHVRIAYSTDPAHPWTRESAEQYADAVVACYPPPLRMITEPIGLPTYRFLETTTLADANGATVVPACTLIDPGSVLALIYKRTQGHYLSANSAARRQAR
jgi:hypothetical protein